MSEFSLISHHHQKQWKSSWWNIFQLMPTKFHFHKLIYLFKMMLQTQRKRKGTDWVNGMWKEQTHFLGRISGNIPRADGNLNPPLCLRSAQRSYPGLVCVKHLPAQKHPYHRWDWTSFVAPFMAQKAGPIQTSQMKDFDGLYLLFVSHVLY